MQTGGQHDDPANHHRQTNIPDGDERQERRWSAQDDGRHADDRWSPSRRNIACEDGAPHGGTTGSARHRGAPHRRSDHERTCAGARDVHAADEWLR